MDITNNIDLITLKCLTNSHFYDRYNSKKTKGNRISKTDRRFYKKRIINETKKMLRNEFETLDLKEIFNEYVISLVDYFKHLDKRDILQKDYKNNEDNEKQNYDNLLDDILCDTKDSIYDNLISPDELLYNNVNETKKLTLDNFVVKHTPPKENIAFPEQKEINLSEPSLKIKGIKPKKIKSRIKKENIDNL